MKSKSSKAVQPVLAPPSVGSKSSQLDISRANLQAQVASGGINQAQADAEYNRLRGLGAKQISTGNLAAAQTMRAAPPSAGPMVQQPQLISSQPMQAMQRPMMPQNMQNQQAQVLPNANPNAGPPPMTPEQWQQTPGYQNYQKAMASGMSLADYAKANAPSQVPLVGAGGSMQMPNGGGSPQWLQMARILMGQGGAGMAQPNMQQQAQNMPSMFGGFKPFGS